MDLSITQAYVLCALDDTGQLTGGDVRGTLLASCLFELASDSIVRIDGDKVRVVAALPEDKHYLLPMVNFIEGRREVSLETLGREFLGHGDEHRILMGALCEPMVEAHLLSGHEGAWLADETARRNVVHTMEAALAGDETMTRDVAALIVFVLGAGLADRLFGREERRTIDKAIDDSDELRQVKADIDAHFAPIVVAYKASH